MVNPIIRPQLPIPRHLLNINVFILRIKIDIPNRRRFPCLSTDNTDSLEKWWSDEVYILPWIGKDSHHGESNKGSHCAGVVIAGDSSDSVVELARDVVVGPSGAESRTASIVIEEYCQECLFIAHIQKAAFVEEI